MFIPTTAEEVKERGWDSLDVILVTGDTYIDSSYNGSAVVGHWLIENGFRVGIIAQPDVESGDDITRLGEPELFWGVSAGCVDSMVANYAPTGKFRKDDDFTPGGVNDRRPDRACIAYTNLIKKYIKGKPIVLGGIEASLRRLAHYDAWSDGLRRSILFDSKADIITYGMGEMPTLQLAEALRDGKDWHSIRGICYISDVPPTTHSEIPSYESCVENQTNFLRMFKQFYYNCDPINARGLIQKTGDRYLIQNAPAKILDSETLDRIYEMDFENEVHPYYAEQGYVKAMDTIRNSITTHRGCYGECNFCAIAVMQGRTVVSRSEESILREAKKIASKPGFDGVFRDVGGPTANMYGFECAKKQKLGPCMDKRCMYPQICGFMPVDHSRQIELLKRISEIPNVKHVFVASGVRYDLVLADKEHGEEYMRSLIRDGHISGQMKIAPEHVSDDVLKLMGKPGKDKLLDFKALFDRLKEEEDRDLYLTYYLMAAHPGCENRHMGELLRFCSDELHHVPEQVQIFTPTPSTVSTAMYFTRRDWETQKPIRSEHRMENKQHQKDILLLRDMPRMPEDRPPREPRNAPLKNNQSITVVGTEFREGDGRIRYPHKGTKDKKSSPKKEREEFISRSRISPEQLEKRERRETFMKEKEERYQAEVGTDEVVKRVFVRDADAEDRYNSKLNGTDERPKKEGRPRRQFGGDRPRGDRPPRRDGDRPPRRDGDRPRRPRADGDRPRRDGDRPFREGGDRSKGDRPYRPRRDGDRPPRKEDDRPPRRDGDRPKRSFGDRPRSGGRSGDRPNRDSGDRPRYNDKRSRDRRPRRRDDGS